MITDIQANLIKFLEMDTVKFAALSPNVQNQHFEGLVAYNVLRRWHLDDFDKIHLPYVLTGSSRDNQVDSLAIIINNTIVKDLVGAREILDDVDEPSVEYVFIQATTSGSFSRNKMNEFLSGVENFHADTPFFTENEALQSKRAVKELIQSELGERVRSRSQSYLYYVALGRWRDERERNPTDNVLGWRKYAEEKIQLRARSNNAPDVQVVDADRFRECLRHNDLNGIKDTLTNASGEHYARSVYAPHLVRLPEIRAHAKGFMGYVKASEFLKLLEREDGLGLLESLSLDNVRAFQGFDNDVNAEIAETLATANRDQFMLLNNGVTIVAKAANWNDSHLRLQDYQIVNGLQTSYVLYRQRQHLGESAPVYVPVKVVETDDVVLRDAIVRATNRQTAVTESQQVTQQPFARRLWQTFNEQHGLASCSGPLWFERRTGEYESDATIPERARRIFTLRDILGAMTSTFLRQPHVAAQGEAAMLIKIPGQLFNDGHFTQPYLTSARMLFLARAFLDEHGEDELHRFDYHLAHALYYLAVDTPISKNFALPKVEEDCHLLERHLENKGASEQALRISLDAIHGLVLQVNRKSKVWQDLTRTKAALTTPLENRLKGHKAKIKWS